MNATADQLRKQALALTRAQTTDQLVSAFALTDDLIDGLRADARRDGVPVDHDQYMALVTSRGFIMEILEERGAVDLVMGDED